MKIFRFAELDSSSSHAARLLKAAEASPFAVIAKTQTAGRGRSGKSWMSPEGGLYLTLVLDSKLLGPEKLASLPLLVAIATSLWIWQRFGVRLTIKWPNDLLYAASKLGGILCESSVQDGVWGPSIIGLGLNLYAAPELSDQRSISLKQILGREELGDAGQLAEELANFLHESLFRPSLLQEFENFALEAGQVWVDDQQHFVQLKGLNALGHLMVKGLEDGQERSLSSVRHEFQWIYQAQQEFPLVLADIGNTLTKIAIYRQARRDRDPAVLLRFNLSDSKENISRVLAKLRAEALPAAWPVHTISVVDHSQSILAKLMQGEGLQLVPVPKRALRVNFERYKFSDLGIDRVAMSEAARQAMPNRNLIVVSAGTCVTIEVLNSDAYYLGGYILPGLQTKLDALHQHTARLPLFKLIDLDAKQLVQSDLLGFDTKSAIVQGVLRETSLAVEGLRRELSDLYPGSTWDIICTGGDGEVLSLLLEAIYIPGLIAQGIRLMVLGGLA